MLLTFWFALEPALIGYRLWVLLVVFSWITDATAPPGTSSSEGTETLLDFNAYMYAAASEVLDAGFQDFAQVREEGRISRVVERASLYA